MNTVDNITQSIYTQQKVLPSGHSNSFDTGIAKYLGLNAAVIYNHIIYWLKINKKKNHNQHDGKTWMYESIKEISEYLDYLSEKEIRVSLKKLIDSGLIIEGNYNQNKFDRTTWYALKDENILGFSKSKFDAPEKANASEDFSNSKYDAPPGANGSAPTGKCSPYILIQEENNNNTHKEKEPAAPCVFLFFGSHVKLKKEEHEKLIADYGADKLQQMIDQMNDYCKAHGKSYKDYAAAIRQWFARKKETPKNKNSQEIDRRTKNIDGTIEEDRYSFVRF